MIVLWLMVGTCLTIALPVVALPFNLVGLVFNRGKARKAFGFLLALSLAFIASIWIPSDKADLYRHYQQVDTLSNFNFNQLGYFLGESLEPMHYFIKFIVAQTNNNCLLQFLVVLCGYFELFWILCDYVDLKKVKASTFIIAFLYVFSSVQFINFISGLWFVFATINVALGVYCYYFRGTKYLHYIIYLLAASLHLGALYMVIPIIILTSFRLFR